MPGSHSPLVLLISFCYHETLDVLGKALGHVRFEGLQKRLENAPLPGCWSGSLLKHQNLGGIHWILPRAPPTPPHG
jgi:hypothetical protein